MEDNKSPDETQPMEAVSGPVQHGGEGDPLGGGVAELKEDEEVTEGVPEQDS